MEVRAVIFDSSNGCGCEKKRQLLMDNVVVVHANFKTIYNNGTTIMTLVQVRLARDSLQTPWGFRIQGGKDLNQQLTVQRVFTNTPSDGELHRGDIVVAINGRDISSYTHKQALDAISGGGGQIELLIQRPPAHQVNIKPLIPASETRAPSLPYSPTRSPQVVIPIQRLKSGPQSPSRIIPISPAKKEHSSSMSTTAGYMPKKVTLNKLGGGGIDFGSAYGPAATNTPRSPQRAPTALSYRPVVAQAPELHDQYDQPQINYQTQFSAPQQVSPQHKEERGVEEEELGSVNERRRLFMKGAPSSPNALGADEDDYPTAPVWERRKLFGKRRSPPPAINKTRKPIPKLGRNAVGDSFTTFGVDYSKPLPKQQPSKHAATTREKPPPVNRSTDEPDFGTSWSNTLRSESQLLKPWEKEALEMERYQKSTVDESYRHPSQPPVAPKPKIVHVTATSASRVPDQQSSPSVRSVSHLVPPKPSSKPSAVPSVLNHMSPNNTANDFSGGHGQGYGDIPKVVHAQYNSPIGLYSKENIVDTYVGQTQGRALSPSTQGGQKKPLVPGERDWNDSYVYQMIHSSEKSTTASHQDASGQPPKGESITRSREVHETKYPGQKPQRRVVETVTRGGVPDYKFNSAIGLSDF